MADTAPKSSISSAKPISVLFVCLGNICRSPMAEAVFQHISKYPSNPQISRIDSAGTGAYHVGSAPDSRTLKVLRKNGISDYKHSARKVRKEDFEEFDWIFAMDADNLADLVVAQARARNKRASGVKEEGEKKQAKVVLFGEFGGRKAEEVGDPYYGGDEGFDVAYEQMVRFSRGFLKSLGEDGGKSAM